MITLGDGTVLPYHRELWESGSTPWFEYHCFESMDSGDACIWLRSHQRVTVLSVIKDGDGEWPGTNFADRCEDAIPRVYRVRFADGLEWTVFEDELMSSRRGFNRPDPPKDSK